MKNKTMKYMFLMYYEKKIGKKKLFIVPRTNFNIYTKQKIITHKLMPKLLVSISLTHYTQNAVESPQKISHAFN